jgi:predicted PurR-regulated permease PerM
MMKDLELGPKQRATVAAAVTLGAALLIIAAFSLVLWGLIRFVSAFQTVLLPPLVAGILMILLRPYYTWLLKICRHRKAAALILFILSGIVPLGLILGLIGVFATNQLIRLFQDLPPLIDTAIEKGRNLWPEISRLLEKFGLTSELNRFLEQPGESVGRAIQASGQQITEYLGRMFHSVANLFAWAVLPVYFVFFLLAKPFDPRQLGEFLPFLKKGTRDDVVYLFGQFVDILVTFFRGQIIIALLQGVLFALGFAVIGLPYGAVLGLVLGLLNIIPYLGSIAGLAVILPLAVFGPGGGILRLILSVVVFALVQTIEGYLLTPKIMGDRTGLHPALIIFAVFFWGTALGGILGMMLAIPLTAFAVVFWRLLKKKYIVEVL